MALAKNDSGGYRGVSLKLLAKHGLSVGDSVKIAIENDEMSGVLMPRYESASEDYISIKLKSGYNIGIQVGRIKSIAKLQKSEPANAAKASELAENKSLPKIALLSTGGTIASKIDYRTGGVHAALSASELYASVPELASHASIDAEVLLSEYSENLRPEHWTMIADKVAEKVKSGKYRGGVVLPGTDNMYYTP